MSEPIRHCTASIRCLAPLYPHQFEVVPETKRLVPKPPLGACERCGAPLCMVCASVTTLCMECRLNKKVDAIEQAVLRADKMMIRLESRKS